MFGLTSIQECKMRSAWRLTEPTLWESTVRWSAGFGAAVVTWGLAPARSGQSPTSSLGYNMQVTGSGFRIRAN